MRGVWTRNLQYISPLSYPIDHGGWYDYWVFLTIMNILYQNVKGTLNKTYRSQTHFGFTNHGSEMLIYSVRAKRNFKFWFGSPCTLKHHHSLESCILNFQLVIFQKVQLGSLQKKKSWPSTFAPIKHQNWFIRIMIAASLLTCA